MNCGSVWAQTFSYDAFGNISKSGSSSFQPSYSPTTNQMTQIGSFTPTYDGNGDVTNDDFYRFTWDATGRPVTIGGATMTYDALGRMVEQNKSGSYTQLVYDPSGDKLGVMSNVSTVTEAFVPLPAGAKAVYNSSGLYQYWHADWLGSWRLASTPTRSLNSQVHYAPFGEQYPNEASVLGASFAGNDEDTGPDLFDAQFREYEVLGRWPSPDPAGVGAANPANPQSWNRYAYVMNNPLLLTDPMGFCPATAQNQPNGNGQQATPASGPSIFGADGEMEFPPQQMGFYGCYGITNSDLTDTGDDSGMLGMGSGLVSFAPGMSDNGNDIASAFGLMQIPVYGLQADWGITGHYVTGGQTTGCGYAICVDSIGNPVYGVTGYEQVQIGTGSIFSFSSQASGFAGNGGSGPHSSPGVFKRLTTYVSNEFKPGGCYNAFVQGTINANFLSPLAGRYGDVQAGGVVAVQGLATQAGASSSALSGVSAFAAEGAPYFLPLYGLYLGTRGVIAEAQAKVNGTCN